MIHTFYDLWCIAIKKSVNYIIFFKNYIMFFVIMVPTFVIL